MQNFRLLYFLLMWSALLSCTSANDDSVLAVEVLKPQLLLPSDVVAYQTLARGSGVVIESGNTSNGLTGYLMLTAAHVVTDQVNDKKGLYSPQHYPKGTTFEVCVKKQWYRAELKGISKYGDIACLVFLCDQEIPLTCLASKRALNSEGLLLNGYTNGLDQHEITGKCLGEAEYPLKSVAPNCDTFFGLKESLVGGLSGGAIFDKEGNVTGIVSSMSGVDPGVGAYTHVGEIRRFLSAAWDGKYDQQPQPLRVQLSDRAVPRELGDEPKEPTVSE